MRLTDRFSRAALVLHLSAVSACSLFGQDESCSLGTTSCHGRAIRTCVVDVNDVQTGQPALSGSSAKKGRWSTQQVCADDPLLGPATCGEVEGKPACVSNRADAGVAVVSPSLLNTDPVPSSWLRVDITKQGDAAYAISGVEQVTLPSPPLAPLLGAIAAVTYAQDKVVDATLVAFADESVTDQSVWLRSGGATRIALLAPGAAGEVLFEMDRMAPAAPTPAAPALASPSANMDPSSALRVKTQALTGALPAGLVFSPADMPDSLRQMLAPVFALVPAAPLTLVRGVALDLDLQCAEYVRAHSATDIQALQPTVGSGSVPNVSSLPNGIVVTNNVLNVRLQGSEAEDVVRNPALLAFAITQALGSAYERSSIDASTIATLSHAYGGTWHAADEFSSTITGALQDRVSPLLGPGQTLADAWGALHQSAVDLGLAKPYAMFDPNPPASDAEAVKSGFADLLGASDPLTDLVEYLARVSVLSAWEFGPCAAIRASTVDQLAPEFILPLAKLTALRGLGLITGGQFAVCTGTLEIGGEPGLVFHTAAGESLPFTTDFQAVYQPFFNGQMHISWVSHRGYVSTSLDIGYRGTLVPALRLASQAGTAGQDIRTGDGAAAVLAILNATSYQTVTAKGGMVTATAISRDPNRSTHQDRLEGIAFFVTLSDSIWGASVYPLVTAKADAPVWGDAP